MRWEQFCTEQGIKREFVNTSRPTENGVLEQKNQTIVEMAKTMLERSPKAVATAVHILNKSPTVVVLGKTLYEAYFGNKPDFS